MKKMGRVKPKRNELGTLDEVHGAEWRELKEHCWIWGLEKHVRTNHAGP